MHEQVKKSYQYCMHQFTDINYKYNSDLQFRFTDIYYKYEDNKLKEVEGGVGVLEHKG